MKRIKLAFGIAAIALPLFFTSCLKSNDQITGPQGTTGATGLQGSNLLALKDVIVLSSNSLQSIGSNRYVYKWGFSSQTRDTLTTYTVNAYGAKVNLKGQSPIWEKFPYTPVYGTDALAVSLHEDTVTLTYTSASAWPNDSTMNCTIIVIPQPAN